MFRIISPVRFMLQLGELCLCTFDSCRKHGIAIQDKIPIGVGCSASIYKCEYESSERAVKIFRDRKRQEREIEMALHIRALDLPITPRIYLAVDNLIVMDLVRGRSLRAFLSKFSNNRDIIGSVVTKMFEAMFEIHKNGIVHLDLHMENVMVENNSDVKIVDFGESWKDKDFIIDFQRLRHRILNYIDDWESLVHFENTQNERPFAIIKEFYRSDNFRRVFRMTSRIDSPRLEYYCIQLFRTFFFIMNRDLKSLNERYTRSLLSSSL